jgi:hypothetical protein
MFIAKENSQLGGHFPINTNDDGFIKIDLGGQL